MEVKPHAFQQQFLLSSFKFKSLMQKEPTWPNLGKQQAVFHNEATEELIGGRLSLFEKTRKMKKRKEQYQLKKSSWKFPQVNLNLRKETTFEESKIK